MRILSIDQSLTASGIAVASGGKFERLELIKTRVVGYARVEQITSAVLEIAKDCDVVSLEQPTLSIRGSASTGALFGLFGVLSQALWKAGKEPIVINSMHRAGYATGKGNAKKDQVMMAVARRYADDRLTDNNIVDAAIMAAMVARIFGEPLLDEGDSMPSANLAVLTKAVMPGQYQEMVAPELAEERAWSVVGHRVKKPQLAILRELPDASPDYAHALVDFALERGYEIFRNQQWVTCTKRLDQANHTCGSKKCAEEWATPSNWERPILLRQIHGDGWAILTQGDSDHGLPAPVGGGMRAHLHTSVSEPAAGRLAA